MFNKIMENKKILYSIIGGIAFLLVVYIGGGLYFSKHFCPGTTINGRTVGGYSEEKVKDMMMSNVDNYELTLVTREKNKETIKGKNFGLKQDWDDGVEKLLDNQNGFTWIAKLFSGDKLSTATLISYDDKKLENQLDSLACMQKENQKEPVNARISEYTPGKGFTVLAEEDGNTIDKDKLLKKVKETVDKTEDTLNLEKAEVYVEPKVKKEDSKLKNSVKKLNKCAKSKITLKSGSQVETVDLNNFKDWLTIDDNENPSVDEAKLAAYVDTLSKKYTTFGKPKQLKTSYGPVVTISNSHYGWKVDKAQEIKQLREDILSGKNVTRDLNYSVKAASHDGNDYGDSYVEINLTAQKLFVIKGGSNVFESDIVTGNVSKGNGTPAGVFGVTYATRDAVLKGDNYASHVSYWMPFNGNIGMHDATWRNKFGGIIYKTSGSHGCVNLPLGSAQTVFGYVSKGFPVLVYELPGTERGLSAADQAKVNDVVNTINAIGAVTLQSEPAIATARGKYEALPAQAKGQVTNYAKLQQAEASLATLKQPH
ncbi:L,D-transpeptidase family protein [Lachnobacterium bovis]|uniref:L,D-transpeptidase family protein n=1 Tax=Lachnobacterium bovis TaxID=140626 RepID=UPI0003B41244|nr:L,D-transpeptidase family protein [Lachnobacterium bovis]